jgi:hypothetical protein
MKINLHTLTQSIAHVAPLLGNALAGPGGAAVGQVIAAKFGGDLNKPEALQQLIQKDPDATLKLKQIECDHEVELQRMTLQAVTQEQQIEASDRSSAREREIELAKLPKVERDQSLLFLAYAVTLGVFLGLAGLFFCAVPEGNQHVVFGLVSSMATVWIAVMGYFYGSSMGSRIKDAGLIHHLHNPLDRP